MIIQYFGGTSFRIQTKPEGRLTEESILFIDPDEKTAGIKNIYSESDIVFFTSFQSQEKRSQLKGNPMIIYLPGEYSYRKINIIGYDCEYTEGKNCGDKCNYCIDTEDIRIVHLGTCMDIAKESYSQINNCDILMVSIGGMDAMDVKKSTEIIRTIEPKIIIPMYYGIPMGYGQENSKEAFYSEMAIKDCEVLPKLTIKTKDITNRNMDIVELLPQI